MISSASASTEACSASLRLSLVSVAKRSSGRDGCETHAAFIALSLCCDEESPRGEGLPTRVSLAHDLRNAPPGTGQKTWSGSLEGCRRGAGGVPLISRIGDGVKSCERITACARSHCAKPRAANGFRKARRRKPSIGVLVSEVESRGRVLRSGPGVLG